MMRWPPRRCASQPMRGSSKSCCAHPTRTWLSACAAIAWCSGSPAARVLDEAVCGRASAFRPLRSPTGSRSSETTRTDTRRAALGRAQRLHAARSVRTHRGHSPRRRSLGRVGARRSCAFERAARARRRRAVVQTSGHAAHDVPLSEDLDALSWRGASRVELEAFCAEVGERALLERVVSWRK